MINGCISGGRHRIGGGFNFVMQRVTTGTVSTIVGVSADLGAYYGTSWFYGQLANDANPGGLVTIDDSSGRLVRTSYIQGSGAAVTITPCYFAECSVTTSGNGTVGIGGTAYSQKYRKVGDSITISFSPSSGYRLKRALLNGSDITSSVEDNEYDLTVADDFSVVAYFVPTAYTVTCNAPSGGSVSFAKNGAAATVPFSAAANDIVTATLTPDASHAVQSFSVNGAVSGGGSFGPQSFTFTVFEREDGAEYACTAAFSGRTAIADFVTTDAAHPVTVTTGGSPVAIGSDGSFLAYVGGSYTASVGAAGDFYEFGGWLNANGDVIGTGASYAWLQSSASIGIAAKFTERPLYSVASYVGTSTADYGTGSTAYVAGCRASITSSPLSKDGRYLGGSFTVTASAVPDGWEFSGVYVKDTDNGGGTRFYKANGSSAVTFSSYCNAVMYLFFANGTEEAPEDTDQGDSRIATGTDALGVFTWEGGTGSMRLRWHSGRIVAERPLTLSSARVYADDYSADGGDGVTLKTLLFQSPDSTDTKVTEVSVKGQSAFRLPMRRAEKYVELEVSANSQVTHVAVATSMEALW